MGSTILAILIGAVIVGNTMLLSLFERTRELACCAPSAGPAAGRAPWWWAKASSWPSWAPSQGLPCPLRRPQRSKLSRSSAARCIANYTNQAFWRGLYTGLGMAIIGLR